MGEPVHHEGSVSDVLDKKIAEMMRGDRINITSSMTEQEVRDAYDASLLTLTKLSCAIYILFPAELGPGEGSIECAIRLLEIRSGQKVEVKSADVEVMLFTVAFLQANREHLLELKQPNGGEHAARIAIAEATLMRISKEAMLESPVAKAFLAECDRLYPKGGRR